MQTNFKLLLLIIICCQISTSRQVTLEEYIKNQNESKYYVFHTYSSKQAQKQIQHFPSLEKLIFTTPWNPAGNQLTIEYAHKLDYVVPCWYEIAFKKQHILIDSDANYNETYIQLLRYKNPNIKILPRVSISGSKKSLIQAIGTVEGRFKRAVSLIATLINKQDVDGLVIETPHNLFLRDTFFQNQEERQQNTAIKNLIVQLVNSIRINLYKKKLIYFHIPNPSKYINEISNQRFVMLHVDGFMVQAFDSVEYDIQLKNAILWAKLSSNIKVNAKYFILLPFFSRRQRQGIKTSEIYKALQSNGFIYQNIEHSICTFVQARTHVQSYVPCYSYFKTSFEKIKEAGFDVGFWQAGDGLQNYFLFM